jgi:XRE family aerobic/anaerobic benzoate catabolism transcriptional regulator
MHLVDQPQRTGKAARATTEADVGDGDAELLEATGRRVREWRARRGLTRRALATASGVSERFLAQLEGGAANPSLLTLLHVARALDLSLVRLLGDDAAIAPEVDLATQQLRALSPAQVRDVRRMIGERFGGEASRRSERIALIGLRGAGKSTLGRRLAEARGVPFVELDREIEKAAGTPLAELFLVYGQGSYRRWERRCLDALVARDSPMVIATGGSIVSEPATFERLLARCFTVWLRASPEEHMERVVAQGDQRPMAGSDEAMSDLRRILAARAPLYERADAIVDTGGRDAGEAFRELLRITETQGVLRITETHGEDR